MFGTASYAQNNEQNIQPEKILQKSCSFDSVEFKEVMKDVLDSLTRRERKVLRLRFGIGMNHDHTLEEVGKIMDLTRERIRQLEAKALRKMRYPSRSAQLVDYLD